MILSLVGLAGLPPADLPLPDWAFEVRFAGREDLEPESFFFPPRASFLRFILESITNTRENASTLNLSHAPAFDDKRERKNTIELKCLWMRNQIQTLLPKTCPRNFSSILRTRNLFLRNPPMPAIFPRPFVLLLMGAFFATVVDFHQTRGFAQEADGPITNNLSTTNGDQETLDKATGDEERGRRPRTGQPRTGQPRTGQPRPRQPRTGQARKSQLEVVEKGKELKNQFLDTRKELAQALIDMRTTHTRFANDEDRSPEAKRRIRRAAHKGSQVDEQTFR